MRLSVDHSVRLTSLLRTGLLVLLLLGFGLLCRANDSVIGDLPLVTWESLPGADSSWSGPVEVAAIVSWFAVHGYPQLLTDLNDDGRVDELDITALAGTLMDGVVQSDAGMQDTDPVLVRNLAEYLSKVAPGQFRIRVFDASFEQEWQDASAGWVWPSDVPGIEFAVSSDPLLSDYQTAMTSGAMTLLGFGGAASTDRFYLAGHSSSEGGDDEVLDIVLTSPEEDRCRIGEQGQVLETLTRGISPWEIWIDGQWTQVEFLLVLEPLVSQHALGEIRAPDLVASVEADVSSGASSTGEGTDYRIVIQTTITNMRPAFRVPRPFKVEQRIDFGAKPNGDPVFQFLAVYVEGEKLRLLNETGQVTLESEFEWWVGPSAEVTSEYAVEVRVDSRCEISESALFSELNNFAMTRTTLTESEIEEASEPEEPSSSGEGSGDQSTTEDPAQGEDSNKGPKGNNGIGNGVDPQPPGNPPANDEEDSSPGGGPGKKN